MPRVALRWTSTVKKIRGHPKTIWRRSLVDELSDMGLTMGETPDCKRERTDIMACRLFSPNIRGILSLIHLNVCSITITRSGRILISLVTTDLMS